MADFLDYPKTVTKFLLNTCRLHQRFDYDAIWALIEGFNISIRHPDEQVALIPVKTGSAAEFYIKPMLSCVGDYDIMIHRSNELAIPAGTAPPTQLPGDFDSYVKVFEIVDSEFPGYVYLVLSYLLTECIDDGKYNAVECERILNFRASETDVMHGPATVTEWSVDEDQLMWTFGRLAGSRHSVDFVSCCRCLSWPQQAAEWPSRHINYSWPNSAIVDRVVSNGCDVVCAAHRQCRRDEWMRRIQHRLSFSRAEIVLVNSWIPVQQIIYHVLRVFVKIERLTDSANISDAATLSNYHIKTLMLWACELKPKSWWIDDLNVVRLSVQLLHTLGVWLTDARCQHYFIYNCNLLDSPHSPGNSNCSQLPQLIATRLMSETEASLAQWFINSYVRKCAKFYPDDVSRLFDDVSNRTKVQKAVSALVDCRFDESLIMAMCNFTAAQHAITSAVTTYYMTVRSCLYCTKELVKIDRRLTVYFTAVTFLHVAYEAARDPLKDELLDVLATTCLQSNDARRCLNARHSSVLSLSQAAKLMKVVANNSRSTAVQLRD